MDIVTEEPVYEMHDIAPAMPTEQLPAGGGAPQAARDEAIISVTRARNFFTVDSFVL